MRPVGDRDKSLHISDDKRLRLLAAVSLLSLLIPMLVSSLTLRTTFVVLTDSMSPSLMPGDLVLTATKGGEITEGAILVFRNPLGGYEVHRVVGEETIRGKTYYRTKGDANSQADSFLISSEGVVGLVQRVVPRLGAIFLIPREIMLTATITLIVFYIYLIREQEVKPERCESTKQPDEKASRGRRGRILQASNLVIIILLTSVLSSSASVKLTYGSSPSTTSITSPKVVLRSGVAGDSTIHDDGVRADVCIQAPLWLQGWRHRWRMSIDHSEITSTLSDFPVLIYLSASSGLTGVDVTSVFDEVGANAQKIAVTTGDMVTQCYVEVEEWDAANRQAWLWVKVPSIGSAEDTDLYLYYDNTQAYNTAYVGGSVSTPGKNVWDSDYKAVWHLNQLTGGDDAIKDSTTEGNHGTDNGSPTLGAAGRIGDAVNFDGDDDCIMVPDDECLRLGGGLTIEAWINVDAWVDGSDVVFKGGGNADDSDYQLALVNNGEAEGFKWDGTLAGSWRTKYFTTTTDTGTWIYLAVTHDASAVTGYRDGSILSTQPDEGEIYQSAYRLGISLEGEADRGHFDGRVDEVRISDTPRSAPWIKASFESERDHLIKWDGWDTGGSYDYILLVENQVSETWLISLEAPSGTNLGRIQGTVISIQNGSTSDQIIVSDGAMTRSKGPLVTLPGGSTLHIKVTEVQATAPGESVLTCYLVDQIQGSGVNTRQPITLRIT